MPGGTSYYFSHGIRHLKDTRNYKLITALAPSEYKAVEDLRAKGIQVEVLPSRKTVYFENIYGENQDDRKQRVLAKADPFTVEELKDEEAKFFHLGSLLSDDFSLDVVKLLSGKGKLAVDAQGYLREVRGEQVYPTDWKDKREALKYIDILKVNEYEAEVLTGFKDFKQAALQLAEWGVKEVLLTLGSLGSIIYAEGTFYKIPAYPAKNVVDATGCGDTYSMGYLYMRNKGASYEEAGWFRSCIIYHQTGKVRSFLRYGRAGMGYYPKQRTSRNRYLKNKKLSPDRKIGQTYSAVHKLKNKNLLL